MKITSIEDLKELKGIFDDNQIKQIRIGLENNLDVSKYADPKYDADQMKQIRFGLFENLDVSKYADPKYNSIEMEQLRLELLKLEN